MKSTARMPARFLYVLGLLTFVTGACHHKKDTAQIPAKNSVNVNGGAGNAVGASSVASPVEPRSPAAVKPFSGPGFDWLLSKGKTFKEKKFTLKDIQKTPTILAFDEYVYEPSSNQFIASSRKDKQIKSVPQLEFEFEKQKVQLTLKTVLEHAGEKILVLNIGEKTQDLLQFDAQKWTMTLSWAGDFNKDRKLDLVLALGNISTWMTVVASSADSDPKKQNFVSLESFQRENPSHGE